MAAQFLGVGQMSVRNSRKITNQEYWSFFFSISDLIFTILLKTFFPLSDSESKSANRL